MALGNTNVRRQTLSSPPRRGHVPPLPHSSWRVIAAPAATAPLTSARDFWDRLGL